MRAVAVVAAGRRPRMITCTLLIKFQDRLKKGVRDCSGRDYKVGYWVDDALGCWSTTASSSVEMSSEWRVEMGLLGLQG